MDRKESSWFYRHKFLAGCAGVLLMMLTQHVYSHKEEIGPVTLLCNQTPSILGEVIPKLPDAHYLFSDTYGWFDKSHFNAGQPGQVLLDLQTAVDNGGGIVTVRQGVRDNITGYTATYRISPQLSAADVTAAALSIYMDWSVRFEDWQGQPPRGLVGPLTPFAVEDLPSQYLGFYAQANDMTVDQVFACYLGPVSGSEEGPPDFVMSEANPDEGSWAGIARVQNRSFTPLVETESGWQHISWPKPLQMSPIASNPHTWQFLSEATWYLGDEAAASRAIRYPSPSFRRAR
jgi:uncharacterized protein (DUF3820 family)